jgi:hypothetical protein
MTDVEPFAVTDPKVSHVIIELFGGDNNLSKFVKQDLQEMAAGNHGSIAMIGLADYRNAGGQVIELSPSAGLRVVEQLGEIDTGDPETLADFLARAMVSFPDVPHRGLGFWDHGSGVFDEKDEHEIILDSAVRGVSRNARGPARPARRLFIPHQKVVSDEGTRAMLNDETSGGILTNVEASAVMRVAFERAGSPAPFDILFSDTCLNGMVEVTEQFREFATVIVGSEELEPGAGWDSERFYRAMSDEPPATPEAWGTQAVDAFGRAYQDHPNLFPCTLAAFRSVNAITDAFAALVAALQPLGHAGWEKLLGVRSKCQPFGRRDSYDIRDFAANLKGVLGAAVDDPARKLIAAVDEACVRNVALGSKVDKASGLAFWFPSDSRWFGDTAGTYRELDFDKAVGWASYLSRFLS